jgi:hypothetical protein
MVYADTLRLQRARPFPLLGYYTYYKARVSPRGRWKILGPQQGDGADAASGSGSVVDVAAHPGSTGTRRKEGFAVHTGHRWQCGRHKESE